jgi:hypothetical protein
MIWKLVLLKFFGIRLLVVFQFRLAAFASSEHLVFVVKTTVFFLETLICGYKLIYLRFQSEYSATKLVSVQVTYALHLFKLKVI